MKATLTAAMFLLPCVAFAHHGADFITLEDFDFGHRGDGFFNAVFDWEKFGSVDALSSELTFFYVPLPRLAISADVRFAEGPGEEWVYSSVTPRLHLQLTDPHSDFPIKLGFSAGYQFAKDLREVTTTTTVEEIVTETVVQEAVPVPATPSTGDGSGAGTPPCNPFLDPNCGLKPKSQPKKIAPRHAGHTTSTSSSSTSNSTQTKQKTIQTVERIETTTTTVSGGHTGIHNHDAKMWVTRMIAETNFGKVKVTGNLIGAFPEEDRGYWGYGIGARRPVTKKVALGLEAVGDFSAEGEHEVITSAFYEVGERAMLRLGTGFGLTPESPDFTLRTGVLVRF